MTDDGEDPGEVGTPDVKTAPDGTPIRRTTSPEQWEAVGRRALADVLRHRRDETERAIEEAVAAIEYGAPVDEAHVRGLRRAVEALEADVERRLVPLVDGLSPGEQNGGRTAYGRQDGTRGTDGDGVHGTDGDGVTRSKERRGSEPG